MTEGSGWVVFVDGSWQKVASEEDLREGIRRGQLRPDTMARHEAWPDPFPMGRIPDFAHLFGGVPSVQVRNSSSAAGRAGLKAFLWAVAELVVVIVVVIVGGRSPVGYVSALALGVVLGALFAARRSEWMPKLMRGQPVVLGTGAATLVVGGALGWLVRDSRTTECRTEVATLTAMKASGELTYEKQGITTLVTLGDRAAKAGVGCENVGLSVESDQATSAGQHIAAELGRGRREERRIAMAQGAPAATGSSATDRRPEEERGGCPTLVQYQSVRSGMTRDDVVAVLGEGEQAVEQNVAGMTGEILEWKCVGFLRAGVLIVQFQNGRVVQKSQQGLR